MGPGSGSMSMFDFAVEKNVCYCFLSHAGAKVAKAMMDGDWDVVERKGQKEPHRAGLLQLIAVPETDARAEAEYARHVEYFYHKCLHVPAQWFAPPATRMTGACSRRSEPRARAEDPKTLRYRDFVEKGYVIAGSPAPRAIGRSRKWSGAPSGQSDDPGADRLDAARATKKNIDLFAREVRPRCGRSGTTKAGRSMVAGAAAVHPTAGGGDVLSA